MDQPVSASKALAAIRPYRTGDREAVRAICADTGFLGQPIDPVFEDRELFADYLTAYYTDAEPDAVFVCELEGEVKGYLMGSREPRRKARYERRMLPRLVVRGLWRLFTRPYHAASRRYIWWIVTRARREVPFTPPDMPHFHINIRPEARNVPNTGAMVNAFLAYVYAQGDRSVYGQVVTFEGRRGRRLFERFGFKLVDEREVTKYRAFHPGKIYLFTVVKDLTKDITVFNGSDLEAAAE